MISGAVPVIVAPEYEINHIMGYPGTPGGKPPLIYSDSWENALEICRRMTDAEIDQRRELVVGWYQVPQLLAVAVI